MHPTVAWNLSSHKLSDSGSSPRNGSKMRSNAMQQNTHNTSYRLSNFLQLNGIVADLGWQAYNFVRRVTFPFQCHFLERRAISKR